MAKKLQPKDLGIQSTPAGFNIPKIKKIKSTAVLNYVSTTDRESLGLIREIDRTCLDPDQKIRKQWKLNAVHMISPASIVETRYREKRAEMKEQGGARLQQETLGFYICRDKGLAVEIARTGIKANPYVKGYLGNPSQGVYLFRYLDVALLSQRESRNAFVMVFKVLQGRAKPIPLTEMGSVTTGMKEPTPNFDCHVSQSAPHSGESVYTIFSKSQMYLYEYTEDAVPTEFPRQCLPYALLEFGNRSDPRMDSGMGTIGPKSISTSAANAGWASARRLSAESSRKAGPELPAAQPSKEYSGFAIPPPVPSLIPSSPKETPPAVAGGSVSSDSGTWRAPLDSLDSSQPVAKELSGSPDKLSDVAQAKSLQLKDSNHLPLPADSRLEHDVSAAAQFGQGPMPASSMANRDPRLQRLSRNGFPISSLEKEVLLPGYTTGVGQQIGAVAQNVVTSVCGQWERRNSVPEVTSNPSNTLGLTRNGSNPTRDNNEYASRLLFFGRENQSVVCPSNTPVNESTFPLEKSCDGNALPGQEPESNTNKMPCVPSLDRIPTKSALKKPTDRWPLSSQVDGSKKKKTLSYQDYLKKKKAEAEAGSEGTATVKSASFDVSGDKSFVKGSSKDDMIHGKQSFGFQREEFQGCNYHPPEMIEQNKTPFTLADADSCIPAKDTVAYFSEQKSEAHRTKADYNSSENLVSCSKPTKSPKPARRDPRLHSSYISSVYSQKIAGVEPSDSGMLNRPEGTTFTVTCFEDKSENTSAMETSVELPSDSQIRLSATQGETESREQKESENESLKHDSEPTVKDSAKKESAKLHSEPNLIANQEILKHYSEPDLMATSNHISFSHNCERDLMDIAASHQVLFADLEETDNENPLSMFLDETPTTEHSPEEDEEETGRDLEDVTTVNPDNSIIGKDAHDVLNQGNVTIKRESCDQKLLSAAGEHVSEHVNVKSEDGNIAKGLIDTIAPAVAESPDSGLSNMKSSNVSPASGSSLSASGYSASSKDASQILSPGDIALNFTQGTGGTPKSAGGKKQKSKGKRKDKIPEMDISESTVDYAMLRLAKGLRPGKSIHVDGLGKNPTDDPLPVLEGKRRKKKYPEETKKSTQKKVTQIKKEKSPQKSQTAAKKPRKKRRATLTAKKKGKKKAPAPVFQSPPNDDDIDYTDFQFEEPQEFCVSIGDDMEKINSISASPAVDAIVKSEPSDWPCICDSGQVLKTEPDTEVSASGRGTALPLSFLGLHHWTEALVLPSLNPQVALVDFFEAFKGLADFDNCAICQKVIDQAMIDDGQVMVDEVTSEQGADPQDACSTSSKGHEGTEETSEGEETMSSGDVCADKEKITPGDGKHRDESLLSPWREVCAEGDAQIAKTTEHTETCEAKSEQEAKMLSVVSENKEVNGNKEPNMILRQGHVSSGVKNVGLAPSGSVKMESVMETKLTSDNDHSSIAASTMQGSQDKSSTSIFATNKTEMSSKGTEVCSDAVKDTQNSESPLSSGQSPSAKDGTDSSFGKLPSSTPEQPLGTEECTASQDKYLCNDLTSAGNIKVSTKTPFSLAVPLTRFPRPRPALSVCSQGSTKQNWQRWKISQAQQLQLKTGSDTTGVLQNHTGVSCVERGKTQGFSQSQESGGKQHSSSGGIIDSQENNTSKDHTDIPSSSSDSDIPKHKPGNFEKLDHTCSETVSEKAASSGSNSHAPVQRKSTSRFELGYWLGINELASLHQSGDSVQLRDKTEIYSRCASKISPTKLSQLVPGKDASPVRTTPPTCSLEVSSVNTSHLSCVVTGDVKLSVSCKQTNQKTQEDFSSGASHFTDVKIKSSQSDVITEPITGQIESSPPHAIKACDILHQHASESSYMLDQPRKGAEEIAQVYDPETAEACSSSQQTDLIYDGCKSSATSGQKEKETECNTPTISPEITELPVTSDGQHDVQKVCKQKENKSSAFLQMQTEQSLTSAEHTSGETEKSELSHAVQQTGEEISSQLGQSEMTVNVPEQKNTDFFDIVIKKRCSLSRQPQSSIPGLDLLTSSQTEEISSTSSSANVDSDRKPVSDCQADEKKMTTQERVEIEKQQHESVTRIVSQIFADTTETDKECTKVKENDKERSSPHGCLNQELDIVGTPGSSNPNQSKCEKKTNLLSFLSRSLTREKENANKVSKRWADDEKNSNDNLQSFGKDVRGAVDGNALGSASGKDNEGERVTGCPIPSFTRVRANQKGDWKDINKQLDLLKGKEMDDPRNICKKSVHSQNTSPVFQTAVYGQPRQPGTDLDSDPNRTRLGQFHQNPLQGHFHSDVTYISAVQQQPVAVSSVFVPGLSLPLPSMPIPSVHRPPDSDPVPAHNSNPVVISKPSESISNSGQHIPFTQPMVPPLFTTPPPLLALMPAVSLHLTHPVAEVSMATVSTPQIFSVPANQVCVTAADSSQDSAAALQTTAPPTSSTSRSTDSFEGSRDNSKKSEIDVISWFAKREAAEKNPPKKDVIDWFSDIIDKKRSGGPVSDLEPEIKKAKLDFMESLNHKKNSICESKENGDKNCRKTAPTESRSAGNKDSSSFKRRNSTCSSESSPGTKKTKTDGGKLSFKVGLSSDAISKKRGPLRKSVLGSLSDSDESPESGKDAHQTPTDEKSKSDPKKNKTQSSEVCGKLVMEIVKGSKQCDTGTLSVERHAHDGKVTGERNKDRKKNHSRWDQKDNVPKKSTAQHDDNSAQQNDTDDDMNDYAHALLEGDLGVKSLGTISNRISNSILKSVSSVPKSSKACDKSSTLQKASDEIDKKSCNQKETKSGKPKSNLTDKPLEFLLFAKEMIMQKLQEQEEESESMDSVTQPTEIEPTKCQESDLIAESDLNSSQQISQRLSSDSKHLKNEEEEKDLQKYEPAGVTESNVQQHTESSALLSASKKKEENNQKDFVCQPSTSADSERKVSSFLPPASSERMVTTACVQPKATNTTSTSETPDAFNMSAITEEEINKLKDIVCQLTALPVTKPSDRQPLATVLSTSAKKDTLAPSIGGNEQKVAPDSLHGKNTQGDRSLTQGNRSKRSSSGGRDWSLFLTTPRSRRLVAGSSSERRNYYGDIIDPPFFVNKNEPWQGQPFSESHGRSHSVSKQSIQTQPAISADARVATPQTSFQSSSGWVKTESSEKPKLSNWPVPCSAQHGHRAERSVDTRELSAREKAHILPITNVTKAEHSVPAKSFQLSSDEKSGQFVKAHSDSAPQTGGAKTPELTAATEPGKLSTMEVTSTQQIVSESSASRWRSRTCDEVSSAGDSLSTGTALDPHLSNTLQGKNEVKMLKDFLLENFPDEDPNSLIDLLDYKLTADVTIMSNKMKKNVLYRIRRHLENTRPVSSTSSTSVALASDQKKMLLEDFAADQIELELRLVEGCLRLLEATQAIQNMPGQAETGSDGQSLRLSRNANAAVKEALSVVVQDLNSAMKDAYRGWRGRPHQSIPTELLLHDEQDKLYTKEGVFIMLVATIPSKPFAKLLQFRKDIEESLIKIGKAAVSNETFVLQQEKQRIRQIHNQRLLTLQTFTGIVSSSRLRKVKATRDTYATAQNHLLQVLGEKSIAKMVFLRASFEAIQKHLQNLEGEMM
ncbi:uncharacterized protein LOC143292885 [Babylonia areolata]|uniref:uncharacterized protein LOC143292885 n=1 Tax=Babylonia areolata TaxID=304850 RepID=UPI003FD3DED5